VLGFVSLLGPPNHGRIIDVPAIQLGHVWCSNSLRGLARGWVLVRKIISLVLGTVLVISGVYGLLYLLFFTVNPVRILYFLIPGGLLAIGIVILWEDLAELLRRR